MDTIYFHRIKRILGSNVKSFSPEQGKELTKLIEKKVQNAESKTNTKPGGSAGDKSA